MKTLLFLGLLSLPAFAEVPCTDLGTENDKTYRSSLDLEINDENLKILKEAKKRAIDCGDRLQEDHYDLRIKTFEVQLKPKPKHLSKDLTVECDYKEDKKKGTITLTAKNISDGVVTAYGTTETIPVELTFNPNDPKAGRELNVFVDGARLSKNLSPGHGDIEISSGLMLKMMGVDKKFSVKCFPKKHMIIEAR